MNRLSLVRRALLSSTAAPVGLVGLTTSFAGLVGLTAVAGWGMLRRNPAYVGPALRVADNASAAVTDVDFNADGYVTGTIPYGLNGRVVTLYDQWGTDDLTCAKSAGLTIIQADLYHPGWRIQNPASSVGLRSTQTVATAAWALTANWLWVLGVERQENNGLKIMWGVPATSFYMDFGLWMEGDKGHWRVDESAGTNWANTYWAADAVTVQNQVGAYIGDGTAYPYKGFYNDVLSDTKFAGNPITYSITSAKLGFGGWDGLGAGSLSVLSELHIFSSSSSLGTVARTTLSEAVLESYRISDYLILVHSGKSYVILNRPTDKVFSHAAKSYVILNRPTDKVFSLAAKSYAIIIP